MATFLIVVIGTGVASYLLWLATAPRHRTGFEVPLITLLVLAGGAVWQLAQRDVPPQSTISTLLLAAFAVLGIVFNASVVRQDGARLREEKRRDIRRAIRADIEATVSNLDQRDWITTKTQIEATFAADPRYLPFVPMQQRQRVVSIFLGQIEVLDDDQVETVTRYYALADRIALLTKDLRSQDYKALSPQRREATLLSLIEMEQTLVRYGREALHSLAPKISRTGPVRSAPAGLA